MKTLFEGAVIITTAQVPLMPRSRIDRRKTKPTARKREMEILIAQKGEPVSYSIHPLAHFPTPPFSGLFSDLDGNILFISVCFITLLSHASLSRFERVKIKRATFNAGIALSIRTISYSTISD